MAMSQEEIDFESARANKEVLAKLLTCSICNNIFNDPVNITECLHICESVFFLFVFTECLCIVC